MAAEDDYGHISISKGAKQLTDAGALVTTDDGQLPGQVAGHDVLVGVAHPGGHHLDADLVGRMRAENLELHVWTVNDAPDIDLCTSLGVDAIITNRPRAVLDRLGR